MRCYAFPYIHRYFRLKSVVFNPCILLYKRGFRYCTARYSTVLILTDGERIYCGITAESGRIASSAPALFILVHSSFLESAEFRPYDRIGYDINFGEYISYGTVIK